MTEIDNELFTLIEAVKESRTFKEYDRCRKVLKSDPELKARVDKYREENYRLQIMEDDGTLQDKIEKFAEEEPITLLLWILLVMGVVVIKKYGSLKIIFRNY